MREWKKSLANIFVYYFFEAHLLVLVAEELAHVLDHLVIGELRVRLLFAQGRRFPECYTEGPHVTGHGEFALDENTKRTVRYPEYRHRGHILK